MECVYFRSQLLPFIKKKKEKKEEDGNVFKIKTIGKSYKMSLTKQSNIEAILNLVDFMNNPKQYIYCLD